MIKTNISWTNSSWNPWSGCLKVSPGCKFCYMHRDKERYGQDPNVVKRSSDATFCAPLKWKDPRLIFTCSWSDFFIKEADPWRNDAFEVIRNTPQHQWQVLTKRIERVPECLPEDWGDGFSHVWLGVSVENQDYIDRIEMLSNIPAKIRFISFEPLLGPIDLGPLVESGVMEKITWAIVGGESGNDTGKYRYRPCEIKWMQDLVDQLKSLGIKVFCKQLGSYQARILKLRDRMGANPQEWPKDLQNIKIQEFPV